MVDRFVPAPKVRSDEIGATTRIKKEVNELKKIVFLIIASLLILGLVLPGCDGGNGGVVRPKIKIGVPYPWGTTQGTGMISGAEMAADEINVAGVFVASENKTYDIQIIGRNDNEISNPDDAWIAVDYLVDTAKVDFVVGGFRTEAVEPMIQKVFRTASPSVPYFIVGSSTSELLAGGLSGASVYPNGYGTPYYAYNASSAAYEYIFRVSPMNSGFLMGFVLTLFAQAAQDVQSAMGWSFCMTTLSWPHKVKVAIVAENLTWCQGIIGGYRLMVGALGGLFGWELNLTKTFGDNAPSGEVSAALTAIENAQNMLILTALSGPVGITFGKQMGALGIHAIPVGINVEAQNINYDISTTGGAENEITTGTWVEGVNSTDLTADFIANYKTYTGGAYPVYTAASYDMVYALADAIEKADSRDKDDVCDWLRTHDRNTTSAHVAYYPAWDQVTHNMSGAKDLPALNAAQVSAIYGPLRVPYHNYTMPPFITNDLIYGPGYATGLGYQWINGTMVGVYPNSGYDLPYGAPHPLLLVQLQPQSTIQSKLSGIYWSNALEYAGIQDITIPASYVSNWTAWYP